jgi:outer membrane immunogenic protein
MGDIMRKLTLGILAAAGLALGLMQSASAADLGRPVYKAPPPMVVAAYNWSGFYVGVHAGYGWGEVGSSTFGGSSDIDGWLAGGQLGWNWQAAGSPWVFGVEVDSSWSNIEASATATAGGIVATAFSEIDYMGTARLRFGYAWDRVLWYVTGGLAWANNEIGASVAGFGVAAGASSSNTHMGWTIGTGLEWALADNWSAKLEYLYADLGAEPYFGGVGAGGFDADLQVHTVKLGLNYRFNWGKGPVMAKY